MDDLLSRLDAIDAKLDYVVERQRYVEELIDEMTPVAREAIDAVAPQMADWERRGLFALLDAGTLERILGLVRDLTQPDVLAMASEATEVIHHADDLPPVGVFTAVRASSDRDVQRGMAVALELLKHLGRSHGSGERPERRAQLAPAQSAPAKAQPPKEQTAKEQTAKSAETVEWRGVRFTTEGFLVDPSQWTEALAVEMASGLGVALTDEHWAVLRWARADYLESGASPNVRRVASGSGVGTRRMYELFPKTPGKTAAMIAGIPKPVGCV